MTKKMMKSKAKQNNIDKKIARRKTIKDKQQSTKKSFDEARSNARENRWQRTTPISSSQQAQESVEKANEGIQSIDIG